MKIALVHDYLTQSGGAERVFELLCQRFPDADIYTSIYDREKTIDLGDREVTTTFLQNLPQASKYFRLLAPLYFSAFRSLDLSEYDLILTSCASFSKAVQKRDDAHHICFCHNITRFLWDTQTYLSEYATYRPLTPLLEPVFQILRQIDLRYAQTPDLYIANSTTVAERIKTVYSKDALVINYPIDTRQFTFCDQKEDFYLVSARLISYKRVDLIVEAFNQLGLPLLITGEGPEKERLMAQANSNIQFLGHVSDEERRTLMRKASGVIVAALEDYGLVPIEANASGTPVICYGAGGVLDTQVPGITGLFFPEQTAYSIQAAIQAAKSIEWDCAKIRDHAIAHFSQAIFFEKLEQVLAKFHPQLGQFHPQKELAMI
jgi:glycosyltransferase involved in cell wall biosynthesis